MNDKVEKGELNRDEMLNEAQGIYGQLGQTDMFNRMAKQAQQSNQRAPQQSDAQHSHLIIIKAIKQKHDFKKN